MTEPVPDTRDAPEGAAPSQPDPLTPVSAVAARLNRLFRHAPPEGPTQALKALVWRYRQETLP